MLRWMVWAALLLTGCKGELISPTRRPPGPDAAEARLRRLSPEQYENTVRDLLGLESFSSDLPGEQSEIVSMLAAQKLSDAAETLVALGKHRAAVPCDVLGEGSDACFEAYVQQFGLRAFRRPLRAEELDWLKGIYAKARTVDGFTFAESVDVVTQVILQAPQLFYVHEVGVEDEALPAGLRRLDGYERATRLSYLLWSSTPDAELLAAAGRGELDTEAGVRAQAERLLADPRAKDLFRTFVVDWLELDGSPTHTTLERVNRDASQFTLDSPALRSALRAETIALVDRVMEHGGSFRELLTSREAYVNGPVGELYGVASPPPDESTFQWVTLDATQRAGLFTRGAFLLLQSNPEVQSPIRRGAFLVKEVFCHELGPPPPNASDVPIMPGSEEGEDGGVVRRSIREATLARTSGASCAACHSMINPAGFGLDHYDAIGEWHETEDGVDPDGTSYSLTIDASGEFIATDVPTSFVGGPALSDVLAQSSQVRACVVRRWFERAFCRRPDPREQASVDAVHARFNENDSLRELVLTLVTTPAFLDVRAPTNP